MPVVVLHPAEHRHHRAHPYVFLRSLLNAAFADVKHTGGSIREVIGTNHKIFIFVRTHFHTEHSIEIVGIVPALLIGESRRCIPSVGLDSLDSSVSVLGEAPHTVGGVEFHSFGVGSIARCLSPESESFDDFPIDIGVAGNSRVNCPAISFVGDAVKQRV